MIMDVKLLHPSNARMPTEVTELGILMDFNALHCWNIPSILVTLFEIVTDSSDVIP
jgi:hypothetical protein